MTASSTGQAESQAQSLEARGAAAAESFHPSVFIREEMEARGWSRWELARRMGGDPGKRLLEIDLYFEVGPSEPNLRIGDCEDFARAFEVPAEYFRNLEAHWLASQPDALPAGE